MYEVDQVVLVISNSIDTITLSAGHFLSNGIIYYKDIRKNQRCIYDSLREDNLIPEIEPDFKEKKAIESTKQSFIENFLDNETFMPIPSNISDINCYYHLLSLLMSMYVLIFFPFFFCCFNYKS